MIRKLRVTVDIDEIVQAKESLGGPPRGRCIVCREVGDFNPRYGYPNRVKNEIVFTNRIIHKPHCPMNNILNDDGTLREKKAAVKKPVPTGVGVTRAQADRTLARLSKSKFRLNIT